MTEPANTVRDFTTGERFYLGTEPSIRYPSVTSVLDALPKHTYLIPWAAGLVADRAIQVLADELPERSYPELGSSAFRSWLADAWRDNRDDAGSLGTEVHEEAEELLRVSGGNPRIFHAMLEERTEDGDISPEAATRLSHLGAFLRDTPIVVHDSEFTIYNDRDGYAGTCDLAATVDGTPYYLDIKTSRSISPDYALQLAAYSRGEYVVSNSSTGQRIKRDVPFLSEREQGKVRGAVIHLMKTKCKLVEVDISDEMYDCFLSLLLVKRLWLNDASRKAIGSVLYDSKKVKSAE